jgi:hypothetical protein
MTCCLWLLIASVKPVLAPCNKTTTANETAQLYIDHIWKRTRLLKQVILDQCPQFASKVMQEIWEKLSVKSSLSTAFHLQTDGETEWVNQELEQYLHIFCNFQADNWAQLLPFMEFTHNAQYRYQPKFIPPAKFTTVIPTVEEQLHSLDQIWSKVTATLKVVAEIMKCTGPSTLSHQFKPGDLVWLEGTNIHTTHPKAKLAPKRHGPFKVMYSTPTNCKLVLPKT